MNADRRPRLLIELRPAAEGFAGIPQETRLLYAMLSADERLETTGLLNGHNRLLRKPMNASAQTGARQSSDALFDGARMVLQLAEVPRVQSQNLLLRLFQRSTMELNRIGQVAALKLATMLDLSIRTYPLNTEPFFDFVWTHYLSKSIAASERERLSTSRFATIRPGWNAMQRAGSRFIEPPKYVRMNSAGFDMFLSQTPWPARLQKNTQLIVRYHDAIPIYYPHTIHNPYWHQYTHYYSLKSNLRDGAQLVCNSENSRRELLQMFPGHEAQTHVIPCIVSDAFSKRPPVDEPVSEIIRTGIEPTTEPQFLTSTERERFYDRHLIRTDFRYLVMVSTIEPRKNHSRLISAWRMLRAELGEDLKLVIVGRPGWGVDTTIERMRVFQTRGELFNVSRIPATQLRTLYANAAAVVCPSIAEGFDLSGIEAMLSGGVVAASNIAVHKEIYGDGSVYFDPYSPRSAADAIARLIGPDAEGLCAKLRSVGAKVGANYLQDAIAPLWARFFDEAGGKSIDKSSGGAH